MVNLQSYFNSFHEAIKLDYDDNKGLREKRDELLKILEEKMPSDAGAFKVFHQGSYAMNTGIKSLDGGDYDIDVGLLFNISKDDYTNPITVKKWVYDALKKEYKEVEMKKPCVTVKFESDEEDERNYHVDFAVYADDDENDNETYLAKGKLYSDSDNRSWEESDPKTLVNDIKNHLLDSEERKQFRRTIRYLKRWKDIKFKGQVNRPSGIGLTVAALTHFQARYTYDGFTNNKNFKDIEALETFVQNMINAFISVMNKDGVWEQRLRVNLPTQPFNDIYEKMTGIQMSDFKAKLECLLSKLQEAKNETDPVEACKLLKEEFGDDFPVPPEPTTAQKRGPAIIVDHSSA